ncbi:MAG: BNR-4 repeat-containing protein [Deltaproteobacteria bacterium]|nr:BNR-4 repeat-containing protein [Deltaproteobacteria bacterium]
MNKKILLALMVVSGLALPNTASSQIGNPFTGKGLVVSQCEYVSSLSATSPIQHEPYFRGERELFGYRPRFVPNVISFDSRNIPYVRNQLVIQKWNPRSCIWEEIDLAPIIRGKYPDWGGETSDDINNHTDQRVVFDNQDNAYTLIPATGWSGIRRVLLMQWIRSRDQWEIYEIPEQISGGAAVLEHFDSNNDKSRPPVILGGNYLDSAWQAPESEEKPWRLLFDELGTDLFLVAPQRSTDGTLVIPDPVRVASKAFIPFVATGGSNQILTKGNFTYVVWASAERGTYWRGTASFIVRYDHETQTVSEPVFLGATLGIASQGLRHIDDPDGHNIPAITMDSEGYLHVVIGAHQRNFLYTKSLVPHNIQDGWTPPVSIGSSDPECTGSCHYYSYVSLIIDQNDTLHLVARWAGDEEGFSYRFSLVHLFKNRDAEWSTRKTIARPFRTGYSHWYQKLDIDRRGRLFLYYTYYMNDFFVDEVAAYEAKWPEDPPLVASDPECSMTGSSASPRTYCNCGGVRAHDPVILVFDDRGENWRIATSSDFLPPQNLPPLKKTRKLLQKAREPYFFDRLLEKSKQGLIK